MDNRVEQGNRLKMARENIGLKQKQAAELLGIQPGSYSDIENGRNKISTATAQLIIEKLGINVNWVLTGSGDMLVPKSIKIQQEEFIEALRIHIKQMTALKKHYVRTMARLKDTTPEAIRKEIEDLMEGQD